MKIQEQSRAKDLRSKGRSIREISNILSVAKGSVSIWVRDIPLTKEQEKRLKSLGSSKEVVERRRQTRLSRENIRRQIIIDRAYAQIKKISRRELWLLGTSLYWAEGRKSPQNMVGFSNSDSRMIQLMMLYFRKVCLVPETKFRGYIHIHPHLDYRKAEIFWSKVSGIPLENFFKTYRILNKSSKHVRNTLPLGTFEIYVCDAALFLTIRGWTEAIADRGLGT